MSNLNIEKLNPDSFEPFGDVIHTNQAAKEHSINYGNTIRFHDLAEIDTLNKNGKTIINIFRSNPIPQPIEIKLLERHPLSSQAFIPLGSEPYLVIVAPKGDLDEAKIKIFLADSSQGVNYSAGTWHHFSLALNQTSDFLVIDREGESKNCDEEILTRPFFIEFDNNGELKSR